MKTYWEKLQDPRWQRLKPDVQIRDNFTCQNCGGSTEMLHVHHCFYEKGDPWDTDPKFLKTLCCKCHDKYGKMEKDAKRLLGAIFAKASGGETARIFNALESAATVKRARLRARIENLCGDDKGPI